jgi:hypothetical protein
LAQQTFGLQGSLASHWVSPCRLCEKAEVQRGVQPFSIRLEVAPPGRMLPCPYRLRRGTSRALYTKRQIPRPRHPVLGGATSKVRLAVTPGSKAIDAS